MQYIAKLMDYPIRFTDQLRPQIRGLRKKRGLTQGQLGHLFGVGQARIAEIERSPGTVSFDQMLKLLSLLGASLVLRDSLSGEVIVEPSRKQAEKRSSGTPKRRAGSPVAKDPKKPQKPDGAAGSVPTSGRHYVIQPKKGSW